MDGAEGEPLYDPPKILTKVKPPPQVLELFTFGLNEIPRLNTPIPVTLRQQLNTPPTVRGPVKDRGSRDRQRWVAVGSGGMGPFPRWDLMWKLS